MKLEDLLQYKPTTDIEVLRECSSHHFESMSFVVNFASNYPDVWKINFDTDKEKYRFRRRGNAWYNEPQQVVRRPHTKVELLHALNQVKGDCEIVVTSMSNDIEYSIRSVRTDGNFIYLEI